MDDLRFIQQNSNVIDLSFCVSEERKITCMRFTKRRNDLPLCCLLARIPHQFIATDLENHLHESGAIYSEGTLTTPLIRGVQVLHGNVLQVIVLAFQSKVL